MANNDQFRAAIGKWAQKASGGLEAVARVAIQDTAEIVIDNTPVDTGFLVGNWQPSIGAPVVAEDIGGYGNGYAASKIGLVVSTLKAGDTFFYANNAVYARRINYGFVGKDSLGRYYNQSGRHMVEFALGRWPITVEEAVAKLGLAA